MIDQTRQRVALYLVNEYGEFSELMQVARLLKRELNLDGLFVFARDDYGRLGEHKTTAETAGFDAISLTAAELASLRWANEGNVRTHYGNVPDTSVRQAPLYGRVKGWLIAFAGYSVLAVLAVPFGLTAILAMVLLPLLRLAEKALGQLGKQFHDFMEPVRLMAEFAKLPRQWLKLRRWKRHARSLLAHVDPDIIIMGQDYPGSYNAIVVKYALARKVNSVIVPFAMYTARELAESFYYYPNYVLPQGVMGQIFAWAFPAWLYNYRGRNLLRLPMNEILAIELHGLSADTPWRPQSGPTFLFCQSEQAWEYNRQLEKPPERMVLTGSVWNDIVGENLTRRQEDRELRRLIVDMLSHLTRLQGQLVAAGMFAPTIPVAAISRMAPVESRRVLEGIEQNLKERANEIRTKMATKAGGEFAELLEIERQSDSSRSIVIVAWPANQYPARQMAGVADYSTLTKGLIESLSLLVASKKFDVWVSLHPTLYGVVEPAQFEASGLKLVTWPLIEFVHCADYFVATVSSTLIWAVQSKIPSINFDCYNYGYPEFQKMGCKVVTSFPALDRVFGQLVADPDALAAAPELSSKLANYWGFPAGGSQKRIVAGIDGLMRK